MDDLVPNAVEALSLYAENAVLLAPRTIDQLRADKVIAADLAAGAFLITVPIRTAD